MFDENNKSDFVRQLKALFSNNDCQNYWKSFTKTGVQYSGITNITQILNNEKLSDAKKCEDIAAIVDKEDKPNKIKAVFFELPPQISGLYGTINDVLKGRMPLVESAVMFETIRGVAENAAPELQKGNIFSRVFHNKSK